VTTSWDAESNRTEIGYPSGFEAHEARDALGRMTQIDDQSTATVGSFALYGAGQRRKSQTFANGTQGFLTYDGFRRPTEIEHKTSGGSKFAGFGYAWDANDNPLMEVRSHTAGKGDVYSYDKANRLTKVLRDVDDPAAELATPNSEAYASILAFFRRRRTTALLDGLDSLFRAARSRARGGRNPATFKTMINLIAGELHFELPSLLHAKSRGTPFDHRATWFPGTVTRAIRGDRTPATRDRAGP